MSAEYLKEIDRKEIIRYLGYGQQLPDERVLARIEDCVQQLQECASPRITSARFPLQLTEHTITTPVLTMESKNLAKNLKDCEEVVLAAATLGLETDRVLRRYEKLEVSLAVVFQAAAVAAIEHVLDQWQRSLERDLLQEGLYVRPRFSPGYGDLSLDVQYDFLRALHASKTVGITLTEGGMMLPEKSVTAIMGLSRKRTQCVKAGCEQCGKVNCTYRR